MINFAYIYLKSLKRDYKLPPAFRVLMSCFMTVFDAEFFVKDISPILISDTSTNKHPSHNYIDDNLSLIQDEEVVTEKLISEKVQDFNENPFENFHFSLLFLIDSGEIPFNFVVSFCRLISVAQWIALLMVMTIDIFTNIVQGTC